MTIKPMRACCVVAYLLLSCELAADEISTEKWSFFTTQQQRLQIEAHLKPSKSLLSEKALNLGYIRSKRGIRLLLPNKSSRRVKQSSINEYSFDKKNSAIEVIKSIQ